MRNCTEYRSSSTDDQSWPSSLPSLAQFGPSSRTPRANDCQCKRMVLRRKEGRRELLHHVETYFFFKVFYIKVYMYIKVITIEEFRERFL